MSDLFPSETPLTKEILQGFYKDRLNNDQFFITFIKNHGLQLFFENVFIKNDNVSLGKIATSIFVIYPNSKLYSNFNASSVVKYFTSTLSSGKIRATMSKTAAVFISTIISFISPYNKNLTSMIMKNMFQTFHNFVHTNCTSVYGHCFTQLLKSYNDDLMPPPNITIYKALQAEFDACPEARSSIFEAILDCALTIPNALAPLNKAIRIGFWFNCGTASLNQVIWFMTKINEKDPSSVTQCIPFMLKALLAKCCDFEFLVKAVNIIDEQLQLGYINVATLLEWNFLSAFILGVPENYLIDLFTQLPAFMHISVEIFSLPGSVSFRPSVFQKVTALASYFPNSTQFVGICTGFFIADPTSMNMKLLLQATEFTKDPSLLRSLIVVFGTKRETPKIFVSIGGIAWLFNQFNTGFLSADIIADVTGSLVAYGGFPELEDCIWNLPKDSPFFSLPQHLIEKMIYGTNHSKYRPIRTYSMCPYFKQSKVLDPYNAYILGRYYLNRFIKDGGDLFECPCITQIANQYMDPKHIKTIISRPYSIEMFCDTKKDHFPLFQFYPSSQESSFQMNYTMISFWFKFMDKIESSTWFFQADDFELAFVNKDLALCASGLITTVPIDQQKWNLCVIKIQPYLMSTGMIININDSQYTIEMKQKRQNLSFANFRSVGQTVMFIGSAIRLFKAPPNIANILSLGPRYINYTSGNPEDKIITPTVLEEKMLNINFTRGDNCFLVQYYGLPLHFVSIAKIRKLISFLQKSKSPEDFNALLRTILSICEITKINFRRIWPLLLSTIMKCQGLLTSELFDETLRRISKILDVKKIIGSIVYNSELWSASNHVIAINDIINSLFRNFSSYNLHMIDNFELFLVQCIVSNPTKSKEIFGALFSNVQNMPLFMKYITAVLKVAPQIYSQSISWDSLEFRDERQVQFSIIQSLSKLVNEETYELVVNALPFEDLLSLMVVSSRNFAFEIFLLMTKMTKFDIDYLQVNEILEMEVATIADQPTVWSEAIELIIRGQNAIPRRDFFSLGVIMIWAGSVCMVHMYSYNLEFTHHLDELNSLLTGMIDLCAQNISIVLSSPHNVQMISLFYPLILHHGRLFKSFIEDETVNYDPSLDTFSIQNIPVNKSMWIDYDEIIKNIVPGVLSKPPLPSQYIIEKISIVLQRNGFQLPMPTVQENHETVISWFAGSKVIMFLTDLILFAQQPIFSQIFESMFFKFALMTSQRLDPFIPTLVHSVLSRIPICYTPTLPFRQLFKYIHALVGLQFLSESALLVLADIFTAATVIVSKQGESGLQSYANDLHPIILYLFQNIHFESYSYVFNLLIQNAQLFYLIVQSEQSLPAWIFTFNMPNMQSGKFESFIKRFLTSGKFTKEEEDLLNALLLKKPNVKCDEEIPRLTENRWKELSSDFQTKFQRIVKELKDIGTRSPIVPPAFPIEWHRIRYTTNTTHFLYAHLLSHSLRFIQSTVQLLEERLQWRSLNFDLEDEGNDVNNFNPKSYQLSLSSFPYCPPRLVVPSPYFDGDNMEPTRIHRDHMKFIRSTARDLHLNMFELFTKDKVNKFGQLLATKNVKLERLSKPIPSILFCFNKAIFILTYAMINEDNDIEILPVLDSNQFNSFLEQVFIGQWGDTSIFARKVVLKIYSRQVLYVQPLKNDSVAIWTFQHGNFILRMTAEDVESLRMFFSRLNAIAISIMPPLPMLHKFRSSVEIEQMWGSGKISTMQALLVLNAKESRSFALLDSFPVFPSVFNDTGIFPPRFNTIKEGSRSKFPTPKQIAYSMRQLSPFSSFEQDSETPLQMLPVLYFTLPESHPSIPGDIKSPSVYIPFLQNALENPQFRPSVINFAQSMFDFSPEKKVPKKHKPFVSIASPDIMHFYQQVQIASNDSSSQQYTLFFDNDRLIKSSPLSASLNSVRSAVVSLERSSCILRIYDTKTLETSVQETNEIFSYASNLSVSENGILLCVDYEFGQTTVYKIIYTSNFPVSFDLVAKLSWESGSPRSTVSGIDWLCATTLDNTLVIWNVFTRRIHRMLTLPSQILFTAFDELVSGLWVVTNEKISFMDVNGTELVFMDLQTKVTAFTTVSLPFEGFKRSAIAGLESGEILLLSLNLEKMMIFSKILASPHTKAISQISIHQSLKGFMSIDANGSAYMWFGHSIGSPRLKQSLFIKCPICGGKIVSYCEQCHRMVCEKCLVQGTNACSMCFAISSYK